MMKPLHIAKILFLITLLISIGLVGCGEEYVDDDHDNNEYDDDNDDDEYDDDGNDRRSANALDVVFDNPVDAGRPSPSFNAEFQTHLSLIHI